MAAATAAPRASGVRRGRTPRPGVPRVGTGLQTVRKGRSLRPGIPRTGTGLQRVRRGRAPRPGVPRAGTRLQRVRRGQPPRPGFPRTGIPRTGTGCKGSAGQLCLGHHHCSSLAGFPGCLRLGRHLLQLPGQCQNSRLLVNNEVHAHPPSSPRDLNALDCGLGA